MCALCVLLALWHITLCYIMCICMYECVHVHCMCMCENMCSTYGCVCVCVCVHIAFFVVMSCRLAKDKQAIPFDTVSMLIEREREETRQPTKA